MTTFNSTSPDQRLSTVKTAPVVLFAYARYQHTLRTVEQLAKNELAEHTDLIVFSDAAKNEKSQDAVDEVRAYLPKITGFKSVTIHHRPHNFGLSRSIIDGVTRTLEEHESVIVLEDDMVTSPHFLTYMNEGLTHYAQSSEVVSIHGYVYPVERELPETFFLRGADCWGWATWRRGWQLFNPDGPALLAQLKQQRLGRKFDFNGSYPYMQMLEDQIAGRNDSWAIRWYASAFLANRLTLYPGKSLVQNIGNDASGTHCGTTDVWDVTLGQSHVNVEGVALQASELAFNAFENHFRKATALRGRIIRKLKSFIKS